MISGKSRQVWTKKLSESDSTSSSSGSMDLPPIIVNQQQAAPETQAAPAVAVASAPAASGGSGTKTDGSVISINQSNNFVIVDLGQENSSVSIGAPLKVYRGSNEIATLEVIQVRRDICAADIKDKTSDLQVGDVVKFN
jgi:hypothetical protein